MITIKEKLTLHYLNRLNYVKERGSVSLTLRRYPTTILITTSCSSRTEYKKKKTPRGYGSNFLFFLFLNHAITEWMLKILFFSLLNYTTTELVLKLYSITKKKHNITFLAAAVVVPGRLFPSNIFECPSTSAAFFLCLECHFYTGFRNLFLFFSLPATLFWKLVFLFNRN